MGSGRRQADRPRQAGVDTTTTIILCGGRGRRAGGEDKPLLTLTEAPIVARLARELEPLGPVLISANRNLERYGAFGRVVTDQAFAGPLAGIRAGLRCAETATVFICPGDCPGVSRQLAERLLAALDAQNEPNGVVVAHDGQRPQQLHLALTRAAARPLERYLTSGGRSVRGWLDGMRTVPVDCRDVASAFDDVDDAEDLARWRARLAHLPS